MFPSSLSSVVTNRVTCSDRPKFAKRRNPMAEYVPKTDKMVMEPVAELKRGDRAAKGKKKR